MGIALLRIDPATKPLDKSTSLDRQAMMVDIPCDPGTFSKLDNPASNFTINYAGHPNDFPFDTSIHCGSLTNCQKFGFNIPINNAVNLNIAIGLQIANNMKVGADN